MRAPIMHKQAPPHNIVILDTHSDDARNPESVVPRHFRRPGTSRVHGVRRLEFAASSQKTRHTGKENSSRARRVIASATHALSRPAIASATRSTLAAQGCDRKDATTARETSRACRPLIIAADEGGDLISRSRLVITTLSILSRAKRRRESAGHPPSAKSRPFTVSREQSRPSPSTAITLRKREAPRRTSTCVIIAAPLLQAAIPRRIHRDGRSRARLERFIKPSKRDRKAQCSLRASRLVPVVFPPCDERT